MNTHSDERHRGLEDSCEIDFVDREKVESIRTRMAEPEMLDNLAELFNALGDPTRVRILHALSHGELCVCDIAALVGQSNSAVSHQLRVLRLGRLVRNRKAGKMVYYKLDDSHVRTLIRQGLKHVGE
jgi:DNA-binding transcriptional ArsR family regulator